MMEIRSISAHSFNNAITASKPSSSEQTRFGKSATLQTNLLKTALMALASLNMAALVPARGLAQTPVASQEASDPDVKLRLELLEYENRVAALQYLIANNQVTLGIVIDFGMKTFGLNDNDKKAFAAALKEAKEDFDNAKAHRLDNSAINKQLGKPSEQELIALQNLRDSAGKLYRLIEKTVFTTNKAQKLSEQQKDTFNLALEAIKEYQARETEDKPELLKLYNAYQQKGGKYQSRWDIDVLKK